MACIRPFRQTDVPAVASLHSRVFASRPRDHQRLEDLFDRIFFRNPWKEDTPSLVYQDQDSIIGFLGIVPRRMFLNDRPIWAAVSTQFMVEPGSRGTLAAVELLKALFSGPQDLSITDGANSTSRRLWEALGGSTAHLYGIHWTRPLRPLTYAAKAIGEKRRYLNALASLSRPFCKGVDKLVANRTPFRIRNDAAPISTSRLPGAARIPACQFPDTGIRRTELNVEQLLACIARFQAGSPLRAEYDEASLDWILNLTAEKSRLRNMRKVSLSIGAETIGFYCYYMRLDMVAEVVHLNASRHQPGPVLDDLFCDAWQQGAIAVSGRLSPGFMQELSDKHCGFRMGSPWTLIHSRHPEVLNTVCRGEALLSRLDAEWWMPFAA